MPPQHLENLTLKDEIINAFRPIEQLFKIMDKSSPEVSGDVTRPYGEVGLVLCENFRSKLEEILSSISQGASNDV